MRCALLSNPYAWVCLRIWPDNLILSVAAGGDVVWSSLSVGLFYHMLLEGSEDYEKELSSHSRRGLKARRAWATEHFSTKTKKKAASFFPAASRTIFFFYHDHLSEAPIKYPAKNIWGDLWLARRKYIFGLIFSLQWSYTFAQKLQQHTHMPWK